MSEPAVKSTVRGRRPAGSKAVRVKRARPVPPPVDGAAVEESLAEIAYRKLEALIVTLQLPPGQIVSEESLAQRLGYSRTPTREALQRLAREGLVRTLKQQGWMVTEIDLRTQLRLLEVARQITNLTVRLATERSTPAERHRFIQYAEGFDEVTRSGDQVRFIEFDGRFDVLLGEACRNEFAVRCLLAFSGLARRFWFKYNSVHADDVRAIAALHAAQARAIGNADTAEAILANERLVDYVERYSRATLDL